MFCPYACNSITFNQWKYEYDAEGKQTDIRHAEKTERHYISCLREKCAVFNSATGKCEYKG